jgi:uncharacterized membrane protein YgcG
MLEAMMRTKIVMLAVLAGFGLTIAGAAMAGPQNLSCITEKSTIERHVVRDCDRDGPLASAEIPEPPAPPLPPSFLKHEGGRKSDGGQGNASKGNGGGNSGGNGGNGPNN